MKCADLRFIQKKKKINKRKAVNLQYQNELSTQNLRNTKLCKAFKIEIKATCMHYNIRKEHKILMMDL